MKTDQLQSWTIPDSQLRITKLKVGQTESNYSQVFKATYNGQEVAAKCFNRHISKGNLHEYMELAGEISHQNIVKILGAMEAKRVIVMELMPTSLEKLLTEDSPSKKAIKLMASGVADGLNYLHSHGHIHGGLTSANVLVDPATWTAKITDYCRFVLHEGLNTPTKLVYRAPEARDDIISILKQSKALDIYSFGILLIDMRNTQVKHDISACLEEVEKKGWNRFYKLAVKCTRKDQQHRPTIIEVCKDLNELN